MKRDTAVALALVAALAAMLAFWAFATEYGTGFAGKTLWDWLELLVVPLALALGGTIFAVYFTRHVERRQRQTDLTVHLAEGYLDRFDEFQDVAEILARAGEGLTGTERHRIRKLGNWLEAAATLLNHGEVEEALMRDLGLTTAICVFYAWVAAAPPMALDLAYWTEMAQCCAGSPAAAGKETNRDG